MTFLCTTCGLGFPNQNTLKNHQDNVHDTTDTNVEFVETLHSTLRKFEEVHGEKIVRKMGTPIHVQRSLETISIFNSERAGFTPSSVMTIRKSTPRSTPPN